MKNNESTVVSVEIAGEEYPIRSQATPEYTRECAAFVDRTISEIMQGGSLINVHKAGILAALAVTDQLFQARKEADALRAEVARTAAKLASDIDSRLVPGELASAS